MQLPARNRQDYVPIIKRNDYTWPGGKRLAVYFCNTLILRPVAYGEREPPEFLICQHEQVVDDSFLFHGVLVKKKAQTVTVLPKLLRNVGWRCKVGPHRENDNMDRLNSLLLKTRIFCPGVSRGITRLAR